MPWQSALVYNLCPMGSKFKQYFFDKSNYKKQKAIWVPGNDYDFMCGWIDQKCFINLH